MTIITTNLKLVGCDATMLKVAIKGDDLLARLLNVQVAANWTQFGVEALKYAHDKLSDNEDERGWWTYFPIYVPENTLVGSGGYKGAPSPEGVVEIGYEIAPAYRGKGLAIEMAQGLTSHALDQNNVSSVIAHTLGEINPSSGVLLHCGFERVDEFVDPEDGLIWKWQIKKGL